MNINSVSSSLATAVAALSSAGRMPAGVDDGAHRISSSQAISPVVDSTQRQIASGYLPQSLSGSTERAESTVDGTADRAESAAATDRSKASAEARREEQDQLEIKQLSARDREVRAHEQAHAAIGGQYAGAAQFQYQRGPDGVRYAVGGEVPIDVGREATPEATLRKAQIVKRAALAPAEPSPQDRRVAAEATRMETEARQEISVQRARENAESEAARNGVDETTGEPVANELITPARTSGMVADTNNLQSKSSSGTPRRSTDAMTSPYVSYLSSRLNQSIANASLKSNEPGSILDQIV